MAQDYLAIPNIYNIQDTKNLKIIYLILIFFFLATNIPVERIFSSELI